MDINIRKAIEGLIYPYLEFGKYRDLIAFVVGREDAKQLYNESNAEYLSLVEYDAFVDFEEMIVFVEKDWLFDYMYSCGIPHPREFLREEYVSEGVDWFLRANEAHKVVHVWFE